MCRFRVPRRPWVAITLKGHDLIKCNGEEATHPGGPTVLMFPMLAASLVLSTSPNPVPAAGHFSVVPLACNSSADDGDGRSAKRLPVVPSKTGVSSAKGSTRGRSIPLGAMKAFEGTDDDAQAIPAP